MDTVTEAQILNWIHANGGLEVHPMTSGRQRGRNDQRFIFDHFEIQTDDIFSLRFINKIAECMKLSTCRVVQEIQEMDKRRNFI